MLGLKYPGDLTHRPWGAPNLTIVDVEFCVEASPKTIELLRWGRAPEARWARVLYEDGSIEDLFQFMDGVESYSESDLVGRLLEVYRGYYLKFWKFRPSRLRSCAAIATGRRRRRCGGKCCRPASGSVCASATTVRRSTAA